VRAIACGANSSFVSADEAVISWGPSPTCGELGYGDPVSNPKSSTIPKLVDALQGVHCTQVRACVGVCGLTVLSGGVAGGITGAEIVESSAGE